MEKTAKRSGTPEGFRESLKKATTEMLVLFLLRRRPMYTYEMMSEIEALSQGVITFNTLYLTIHRLQDFGYVEEQGKVVRSARTTGPGSTLPSPRRGRSI